MKDGLISVDEACARLRAVGYRVETGGREIRAFIGDQWIDTIVSFKERVQPAAVKALQMKRR